MTDKLDLSVGPIPHEDAIRFVRGPLTQEECAQLLHVSRDHVRKLESNALRKLVARLRGNSALCAKMREGLTQDFSPCATKPAAPRAKGRRDGRDG